MGDIVSLSKYIQQRGQGGIYQLRMAIPVAARLPGGAKERIKSLRTSDLKIATQRAMPLIAKWQAEWSGTSHLEQSHQTPEEPAKSVEPDFDALAAEFAYFHMGEDWEVRRVRLDTEDAAAWAEHIQHVRDLRARRVRQKAGRRPDDKLYGAARSILKRKLPRYSPSEAEIEELALKLVDAIIDAAARELAICEGKVPEAPQSGPVKALIRREAELAKPGETILEQFEIYAWARLQSAQRRPEGMEQDRMVIRLFSEFVGEKRSVASITFNDAKEFVDCLQNLPTGFQRRREFRGLDLREAVAKAKKEGSWPTLSLITQERYISNLSPFFAWLKSDRGGRRLKDNPFDGLHLDVKNVRKQNTRPSFTADEITKIINSPLFTGFERDGREYNPGSMKANDWRKWIPLICLFTGARIGEVAQLRVDDIASAHGILFFEFREDEAEGQRTKSRNCRVVPIHSQLIAIGLMGFVERARQAASKTGERKLFPQIEPDNRGQVGAKPGRWWRNYVDRIGLDKPGLGAHSFRHTISDQLRAAGFLDAQFGPLILGHSAPSVTAGYGTMTQGTLEIRFQMIEAVKFIPIERGRVVEGGAPVDFSHLHQHP